MPTDAAFPRRRRFPGRIGAVTVGVGSVLAGCVVAGCGAAGSDPYTVSNPLPPRLQWNANNGYCGETSLISAGLYYGQYLSQYDARALASGTIPQNEAASQLLLGVNDVAAATAMHLTAAPFDTAEQTDTASFLTWLKAEIVAGHPVAIGLYANQSRFYGAGDPDGGGDGGDPDAGDEDYDHIVTVTGVSSRQPVTGSAIPYPDDLISFSDHGLWTGTPDGQPQYTFSDPIGGFSADRRQANAADGPVYSLPSGGSNYGIAITGVTDIDHETVPVRLIAGAGAEIPAMIDGSTTRPAATPLTLRVTVSGLTAGKTYTIYRYASMSSVPDRGFNANADKAAQHWTITATGPTHTMDQTIMSDEIAVYRAVPTTAG